MSLDTGDIIPNVGGWLLKKPNRSREEGFEGTDALGGQPDGRAAILKTELQFLQ